jgi:hypothetical protein
MGKVINSYKGNAFSMSSNITIDSSLFLPKIDNYTAKRQSYGQQQRIVSRVALLHAQEWLDGLADGTLVSSTQTQRQARRAMANYIKSQMDLKDRNRSYFVPAFVWQWLAGKVIAYVVKLIIEHYWPDLVKEWGLDI